MEWLVHIDLCAGIAGFTLAAEAAGFETILFVEKDAYCQKVLRKHYPAVPVVEDIRNVKKIKEVVANAISRSGYPGTKRMGWEKRTDIDRRCERATMVRPTILVTAGFPCQPFSVAGKREGEADNRYLWPETLAVIEAIKPRWILLENVAGIINLALDTVLSDLEDADYSYETLIIPACAVNAPHRRDRVWIVAHSESRRNSRGPKEIRRPKCGQGLPLSPESNQPGTIPNASRKGLQRQRTKHKLREVSTEAEIAGRSWWAVEPQLGRVAHGIPHRVDRLKCLGNAIVPEVAYRIIKKVFDYEVICPALEQ